MRLLGLEFNDTRAEHVLAALLARPAGAPFAYVVTPNADHFARLLNRPELSRLYETALMCLLDSRFLSHCAKLLRYEAPCVCTGADLVAALLPRLEGERVAVVGMADAAFLALTHRYPNIVFLRHNPPMGLRAGSAPFHAAMSFLEEAGARFSFIAIGSPMQELLAHYVHASGQGVGTALCIGAALEFAAGTRKRAPGIMRSLGLEWLHRLALEPRRLARRYLISGPRVLRALYAESSSHRRKTSR